MKREVIEAARWAMGLPVAGDSRCWRRVRGLVFEVAVASWILAAVCAVFGF